MPRPRWHPGEVKQPTYFSALLLARYIHFAAVTVPGNFMLLLPPPSPSSAAIAVTVTVVVVATFAVAVVAAAAVASSLQLDLLQHIVVSLLSLRSFASSLSHRRRRCCRHCHFIVVASSPLSRLWHCCHFFRIISTVTFTITSVSSFSPLFRCSVVPSPLSSLSLLLASLSPSHATSLLPSPSPSSFHRCCQHRHSFQSSLLHC